MKKREWGWAPEYADAMWRILQLPHPVDVVIGSGESRTVQAFSEAVFASMGLDLRRHLEISEQNIPWNGAAALTADPSDAFKTLGWRAEIGMDGVASLLVSSERMSSIL